MVFMPLNCCRNRWLRKLKTGTAQKQNGRPIFCLDMPSVDFPGASVGKETAYNAGDTSGPGSIPGSGRSPGGGKGNPLQYSFLENPTDWGVWQATVHGVIKSRTQLRDFHFVHFFPLAFARTLLSCWYCLFNFWPFLSMMEAAAAKSLQSTYLHIFLLPSLNSALIHSAWLHYLPTPGDSFYPLLYCSVCVPRNCSPLWSW